MTEKPRLTHFQRLYSKVVLRIAGIFLDIGNAKRQKSGPLHAIKWYMRAYKGWQLWAKIVGFGTVENTVKLLYINDKEKQDLYLSIFKMFDALSGKIT